jgi:UDP-3-O-[3-hydroxymyristoyl] glucosamine N-acyltransferase
MKLADLSGIVQGTILGDPELEITGAAGIREAAKGDITFISSPKFVKYLRESRASCVIVKEPIGGLAVTQLVVSNPYYAFARALELLYPGRAVEPGISDMAAVSPKASIGREVAVLPFVYVSDNVLIGDGTVLYPGVCIGEHSSVGNGCIIYPNVTIRENVRIGDRVIIHSGTVVGSDGFGYVLEKESHYKIPQVGGVVIEDDVEIGSNVSIDRATVGDTVIGRGAKIDNLVQIAHNVKIGEKSLVIAQAGIAGSSELGNFVTLAGQVGVADHVTIEAGTILGAQSGVIPGHLSKGIYSGTPAMPHREWLKAQALFARLPEMGRRMRELEDRLNKLEKGMQHDERK